MNITPLKLAGTFEIAFEPKGDHRGYFMRHYDRNLFTEHGLTTEWAQENQSLSARKGTIRGQHYQRPPYAETKFVRALLGSVWDVFVDLRAGSATYGEWDAVELLAERFNAVYIPRGFAHGFCTLTDECLITYKVDNFYAPDHESGVRWNDPDIGIDWPVEGEPVTSERDSRQPWLRETSPVEL